MISKERLEELIKQGSTIYGINFNKVNVYDLCDENVCISPRNFREYGLRVFDALGYWDDIEFCNLFETKEEAEWHKEFGCIERTERLELPTWEEFDEQKFIWFVDKSQNQCCLYYLNVVNKIFINVSGEVIEIGDLTKENYTLACRKAKELYLGE